MRAFLILLTFLATMASAQNSRADQFLDGYAELRRGNYAAALSLLRPLAEQGNVRAQKALGDMYDEGQGVAQDRNEALKWYRLSAQRGFGSAQVALGNMYLLGKGVAEDHREAAKLLRLAAKQPNNSAAFLSLGFIYRDGGAGIPADMVRAYMWFELMAGEKSDYIRTSGIEKRDAIARKMTPQQIAQARQMATQCRESNFQSCG